MANNFRAIKASIIIGILLVSILAVSIPSISAGLFLNAEQDVVMTADISAIETEFKPVGGAYFIPINISVAIRGLLSKVIEKIFEGRASAIIELSAQPMDEWFSVVVSHNSVHADISTNFQSVTEKPYLQVTLDERAPAKTMGKIIVTLKARRQSALTATIRESTTTAEVSFVPAYLPIISVAPKGNFKQTAPGSMAEIEIELENLGNAKTVVDMRVIEIPEEWDATISARVTLGTAVLGENPKQTVILTVQPPYSFGYHNDRDQVEVEFIPKYYADPSGEATIGDPQVERFTVQSIGFSTPGFEGVFVIFALIGVALIVKKRRQKMK